MPGDSNHIEFEKHYGGDIYRKPICPPGIDFLLRHTLAAAMHNRRRIITNNSLRSLKSRMISEDYRTQFQKDFFPA
jgi:hypothetical protein